MRKTLLLLALVAAATHAAQAQSVRYGLKAGVALTNFTGNGVGDSDYKFGFTGGLTADIAMNDLFSLHPELLYSMKGEQVARTQGGNTTTYKTLLHYIDVPVMARFNTHGLFLEAGPQIGFLVASSASQETGGITISHELKDAYKTADFGYAAGLGYQLRKGPGIGARYTSSFGDILKNNTNTGYFLHNSGFQLYLSYQFGGK